MLLILNIHFPDLLELLKILKWSVKNYFLLNKKFSLLEPCPICRNYESILQPFQRKLRKRFRESIYQLNKTSRLRMRWVTWNRFSIKKFVDWFACFALVETASIPLLLSTTSDGRHRIPKAHQIPSMGVGRIFYRERPTQVTRGSWGSNEACVTRLCSHTFSVGLILEPREGWIVTSSMLIPR